WRLRLRGSLARAPGRAADSGDRRYDGDHSGRHRDGETAPPAQGAEAGDPATGQPPSHPRARAPALAAGRRALFAVTGPVVHAQVAVVQGHRFLLAHGSSSKALASWSATPGSAPPGAAARFSGPAGAGRLGRTTSNSLPRPGVLRTRTSPPCAWATARTSASPSPVPLEPTLLDPKSADPVSSGGGAVDSIGMVPVLNRSKMRSSSVERIPAPVSATIIRAGAPCPSATTDN